MKSVKQTDILTGSIPKQLLLFFLPIWFGTLFQQLYNTADTLIVGNFVGTNALAAVGATGPFVNLLVGLFVGLCSGAGVVIAQSWGAHDPEAVDRQVHTALVLSVGLGALLTVLGFASATPMMRLMGTPEEILADSALYLRIYSLGMIPPDALQHGYQYPACHRRFQAAALLFVSRRRSSTLCWTSCSLRCSAGAWRARRWPLC